MPGFQYLSDRMSGPVGPTYSGDTLLHPDAYQGTGDLTADQEARMLAAMNPWQKAAWTGVGDAGNYIRQGNTIVPRYTEQELAANPNLVSAAAQYSGGTPFTPNSQNTPEIPLSEFYALGNRRYTPAGNTATASPQNLAATGSPSVSSMAQSVPPQSNAVSGTVGGAGGGGRRFWRRTSHDGSNGAATRSSLERAGESTGGCRTATLRDRRILFHAWRWRFVATECHFCG